MAEKVPLPQWIYYIHGARALISVVVLGLVAYSMQIIAMAQAAFNVFVAVWTFLVTTYIITSEVAAPHIYNKWAVFSLEILTLIFWLAGFASLAALAANVDTCLDEIARGSTLLCVAYNPLSKRDLGKRNGVWDYQTGRNWYAVLAAGSGMGAICFILTIITLVMFSRALKRHRNSVSTSTTDAASAPIILQSINGAHSHPVPEKIIPQVTVAHMPPPAYPATIQSYPDNPPSPPPPPPPPQQQQFNAQMPQQPQPQQHHLYPSPPTSPSPAPVQPIQYQYTGASQHQQGQSYQELSAMPAMPTNRAELGQ